MGGAVWLIWAALVLTRLSGLSAPDGWGWLFVPERRFLRMALAVLAGGVGFSLAGLMLFLMIQGLTQ